MSVLPTQPYKGTTDFLPQDLAKRNYIFEKWRKYLIDHSYQEYETSVIEFAEVYKAKSGDELGTKQLYAFEDKGGRTIALRPEQTPSLARMVVDNFDQVKQPARWFSIPNCFRYEQPQRGRRREFWQLNVDIIGASEGWADLEVLKMSGEMLLDFGAKKKDFVIYYNHRGVLDSFLREIGVKEDEHKAQVYKVLDSWIKTEEKESHKALEELIGEKGKNQIACLIEGMDRETELWDDIIDDEYPEFARIYNQIDETIGNKFRIECNPCIVRGLAYYTGLVFEAYDTDPVNPRALFGGGRYDNLLDLYGKSVSCVGFAPGQVPITDFLETHGLMPSEFTQKPHLILIPTSEAAVQKCYISEVDKYISEGYAVEVDLALERSLNKRQETAHKKDAKAVVVE
jgi:histidyl-tRNA synthetase